MLGSSAEDWEEGVEGLDWSSGMSEGLGWPFVELGSGLVGNTVLGSSASEEGIGEFVAVRIPWDASPSPSPSCAAESSGDRFVGGL